jgi:cytochrome b subunit of formate dehydrogenase
MNLDRYQFVDRIIPHVPTLALVLAGLGVLSALFTLLAGLIFSPIAALLGALLTLVGVSIGYAAIMMLYRIYVRVVGSGPVA